jgi:putative DNA methylase
LTAGTAGQLDSTQALPVESGLCVTDPPYYDNVGYADLSDFFFVWLRRSLRSVYPDLFSTLLTPKAQELVANSYRFEGSRRAAQSHFESGLSVAFERIGKAQRPEYPLAIFYAFKQAEDGGDGVVSSTGWETMLQGLLQAGLSVNGTWPMRSERGGRMISIGTNALASSIVLACRPRLEKAALATRKEFLGALKHELPEALRLLQHGSIAPVDLAQAAIGPGVAVFSRYAKVVEADGSSMTVRTALGLINQVLDETLAEQESDFDADTRWAKAWFEQHGMSTGKYGEAETLSRAKNTSMNGLVQAGVVESRAGKVRLLDRTELTEAWSPTTDTRLTVWEVTQHLIRRLDEGGEHAAADLLRSVGWLGEAARELAYSLYVTCERKKWAKEALAYNALVVAWPEIARLAAGDDRATTPTQETML